MLAILGNSALIASYDYADRLSQQSRNQILDKIQLSLQIVFMFESLLKIIGMGFVHRQNSYLRNGWNVIDFSVILLGLVDLMTNNANLKSLRVIRVLQPLRNITRIEKLKHLADTLIKSLPNFLKVSFFLVIIFIIFGIFGLQMHSASFYWRCRLTENPVEEILEDGYSQLKWEIDPNQSQRLCTENIIGLGLYHCKEGTYCGNPYRVGLDQSFDNVLDETFINYGVLTFNNIGFSLLSVFQVLTNDNWAQTMYNLMDSDMPLLGPVYIGMIVILGSFFLINIILAVILDSFISVQQDELRRQFIKEHLLDIAGSIQVDNKLHHKIQEAEKEYDEIKKKVDDLTGDNSRATEQTEAPVEEKKPTPLPGLGGLGQRLGMGMLNGVSTGIKDKVEQEKTDLINDLVEKKEIKEYARDQAKFDIDFLKNTINSEDKSGGISRLTALKRAINVVEPPEVLYKRQFQEHMRALRVISLRAKKNKFYWISLKICQNKFFSNYFIPTMIIINTGVLAADRHPQNLKIADILEEVNFAFYFIFLFEVVVKLAGLGFKTFLEDGFNLFDSFIIGISSIDTIFQIVVLSQMKEGDSLNEMSSGSMHDIMSALRAFRLLRIFKLANSWKKFNDLLKTVWKTLKDISTFTIFLFLFSFIYSLLGLELFAFGCKKTPDDKVDMVNGVSPLNNFDSFYESFLTMFVLLTGDQWTSIMLDYYRAVSPTLALLFFVTFMILGQYMLLNLFLAILLQNFDEDSVEQEIQMKMMKKKQIEKAVMKEKMKRLIARILNRIIWLLKCHCFRSKAKKGLLDSNDDDLDVNTFKFVDKEKSKKKAKGFLKRMTKNVTTIKGNLKQMEGMSLMIFSIESPFRRIIYRIIQSKIFEGIILIVIVISTVQLAAESPLNDPNGQFAKNLDIIDKTTTAVFTLEMLMKIIAFGFIFNGEQSYMQNSTNVLDFVVTSLSIFSAVIDSLNLNVFKVLRLFKILRPLRFITRIESFQVAVQALINATTNVIGVLVISVLFFMIFGIVGVNYFKGQYCYCVLDHTAWPQVRLTGELFYKQDCLNFGGEWVTIEQNFDNIVESMMTLFQMSTLSDWLNVMYNGMSITGVDTDLILKGKPATCFYFIIFVIVGAFFTLNLFVGIVISTYNREKEKIAKDFLLKERQKEWLYAKEFIFRQKLEINIVKHENPVRNFLLQVSKSRNFALFIMSVIILNTIVLMIKSVGEPSELTQATEILNYIFTSIFTLEMIIKLIALGPRIYFREKWNRFDFAVIILTYAFITVSKTTNIDFGAQTTLLRSFRILRIFKFFKATKNLKIMFNTFIVTLPAMSSIGGLLALLIYVYAVLGVNVFAEVQQFDPLNDVQNFQSFGCSFLILIKIATGDGWAELLNIFSKPYSIRNQCIQDPSFLDYANNGYQSVGCGSSKTAVLYFYSYLLVVKLIFLNLFIAVILEGFEVVTAQEARVLNSDLLEMVREKWTEFDPLATGYIKIAHFSDFLVQLGEPLGMSDKNNQEVRAKFVTELNLPIYNDFQDYQYVDVVTALCKRCLIQDEIAVNLKQNSKANQEEIRAQIQKDLQDLDENDDNISSVKRMKREEKRLKAERDKGHKGNVFGAEHEKAARLLIKHLRFFIQAAQLRKGIKTRRYTKEELDAIDAAVMQQFKEMVEGPSNPGEDQGTMKEQAQKLPEANAAIPLQNNSKENWEDTPRHIQINKQQLPDESTIRIDFNDDKSAELDLNATAREPLNKQEREKAQKLPKSQQEMNVGNSDKGVSQSAATTIKRQSSGNGAASALERQVLKPKEKGTQQQIGTPDPAAIMKKQSSLRESIFELSERNYDGKPHDKKSGFAHMDHGKGDVSIGSQDEKLIEEEMLNDASGLGGHLSGTRGPLNKDNNDNNDDEFEEVFKKL